MIEVDITPTMIERAETLSKDLGKLNNSITKGEGNIAGFLGEIIFADLFNADIKHTYDYDVVLKNGKRVDVKTKRTSVKPLPYYDCSIASYNTKQKCDEYAFVRIKYDLSKGWYLGKIDKELYFKKSRFLKEGDIDPDNNFKVRADCYNLKIQELEIEKSSA